MRGVRILERAAVIVALELRELHTILLLLLIEYRMRFAFAARVSKERKKERSLHNSKASIDT